MYTSNLHIKIIASYRNLCNLKFAPVSTKHRSALLRFYGGIVPCWKGLRFLTGLGDRFLFFGWTNGVKGGSNFSDLHIFGRGLLMSKNLSRIWSNRNHCDYPMHLIECFNDLNVPKWFDCQILSITSSMRSEILEWIILDSFNTWYIDDLADKQPTNQPNFGRKILLILVGGNSQKWWVNWLKCDFRPLDSNFPWRA